jgi:CPA2 family monovalent cation:H+ antiporter-2
MGLIADLTFIFLAALAGGMLARRIGQPLIVGYIIAGVAIGPFTAGPTAISHVHDIEQLAELGVVLLLFSLGLEVSFGELAPVRVVALGGATIQVVLTIALGFALALGLGWEWRPALWFGALISLSSTMVALKTIQAQGRLGTLSSRVMLGLLVVQDLAVVPLMIVLPELSDPAGGLTKVLSAAARAAVLLAVIVGFSTRIVPPMMAFVARWNSRELFFLATTTLAVSVGYVAWLFGLSMALGAFVAGLVVSESEYAHQALSDVSPLRDLFGMLFFVSVGMLLDPALLWDQLGALALVVPMIVIGKGAILAGVVRAFGYWNVIPLAAGLTLFQVGEFSFVLARVGRASGAIPPDLYALSMNAAIVTMALTPMISGLVPTLYERYWPRRVRETHESANLPQSLAAHVVIAGAGRVGRSIADALSHLDLPFVLIESDDRRLRQARDAGQPVIYGDATQPVVLEAAGLDTARALLVTVPAFQDVRVIVAAARRLRPEVPVIARADGPEAVAALYGVGVQEVASPEVEAAIEMTQQALMYFHVPAHEVLRVASAIRHERYERARGGSESGLGMMSGIGEIVRQLDFTWVGLPAGSGLDGKTLAELRLRSTIGVTVVGIIRDGKLVANPDGDSRLRTGDLVAVLGTRDQIAGFERLGKSEVRSQK